MAEEIQDNPPYIPDIYDEHAQDVCEQGYVRVMCYDGICLQIHNNIIEQSQLMTVLTLARTPTNPSECIHLTIPQANSENIIIICNWLNKHIIFDNDPTILYTETLDSTSDTIIKVKHYTQAQNKDRLEFDSIYFLLNTTGNNDYESASSDIERLEILDPLKDWLRWRQPNNINDVDKTQIFLKTHPNQDLTFADKASKTSKDLRRHRTYVEIKDIMIAASFLELHPTNWHTAYAQKEFNHDEQEQDQDQDQETSSQDFDDQEHYEHNEDFDPVNKFTKNPVEICCYHLSDMINSCSSPIELQLRFPELIGPNVLTVNEKAEIIKEDLWIHGDNLVKEMIDKLCKEDDNIPAWTLETTLTEREFMSNVIGFRNKYQPIKVPPIETIIEDVNIKCMVKELDALAASTTDTGRRLTQ